MRDIRFLIVICLSMLPSKLALAAFSSQFVQVPVSPDAIADRPELANAQTWQLQISADDDLWSLEVYVRVRDATIFYHPLGTGGGAFGPPEPELFQLFPALAYDSYVDLPGPSVNGNHAPENTNDYTSVYHGTIGFGPTAAHVWMDGISVDPPPSNYVAAQMTFLPSQPTYEQQWLVRAFERVATGGAIEHVITSANILSPLGGDMNLDFVADSADLAVWASQFDQIGVPPFGFSGADVVDFNNDGATDDFDGAILMQNFGATSASRDQGDVDGDGDVDVDDYNKFFHLNWGHSWNRADVDQNLAVDGGDFLQWQQHLGGGFSIPDVAPMQSVPEPTSALVALLALAAPRRPRQRRPA